MQASVGKHPLSYIGVCGLFAHYLFPPGCGWVCVRIYCNLAAPAQPNHRPTGKQGLPGPKEIGQRMHPLRRQQHGLSLFATTVFDSIPWEHGQHKSSVTSHQNLEAGITRHYRAACAPSSEHTHRNGGESRLVSITGS